jgi:two-component system cell cycle sensor histidine kinase/response regulator CckA
MHHITTGFQMPKGSETILVAEGDEGLRTLLRIGLELCGYAVMAATSGHDALRLADEHDRPIELLISDVALPEMDGPELARQLTARRAELKVLLLSSHLDELAGVELDVAVLRKPVRPSALVAKVREILDSAPASLDSRPEAAMCPCC